MRVKCINLTQFSNCLQFIMMYCSFFVELYIYKEFIFNKRLVLITCPLKRRGDVHHAAAHPPFDSVGAV